MEEEDDDDEAVRESNQTLAREFVSSRLTLAVRVL
jgi:hypothetical protein